MDDDYGQLASAPARRVAAAKTRIQTCTVQEGEIEPTESERDYPQSTLAEDEVELEEAVNVQVEGDDDPTAWLPDELLLLIFGFLAIAMVCARVCRRWNKLCQKVKVSKTSITLHRWAHSHKGKKQPVHWDGNTQGDTRGILALALGHNNKLYSGHIDGLIRVWSIEDGKCQQILRGHLSGVSALAVGPDGTVFSSSWDSTVREWSGISGDHLETLCGHAASVQCTLAGRTNLVFSGSDDTTVKVWTWGSKPATCIRTLVGHTGHVEVLALSPKQNMLYSGSGDWTIREWSVPDGTQLRTLDRIGAAVSSIVVGADGTLISGTYYERVTIWRGSDWALLHEIPQAAPWDQCAHGASFALGPDNTIIVYQEKTFSVWCIRRCVRLAALMKDITDYAVRPRAWWHSQSIPMKGWVRDEDGKLYTTSALCGNITVW